jgi:hypothetical protein
MPSIFETSCIYVISLLVYMSNYVQNTLDLVVDT